jgi:hypothetical protein
MISYGLSDFLPFTFIHLINAKYLVVSSIDNSFSSATRYTCSQYADFIDSNMRRNLNYKYVEYLRLVSVVSLSNKREVKLCILFCKIV